MGGTSKTVLGLSFGHGDSSAALVVNGVLVAAAEEERFNRVKHYALYPTEAIRYCLAHAGIEPAKIDLIGIAKSPLSHVFRKIATALQHPKLVFGAKQQTQYDSTNPPFPQWLDRMGLRRAKHFHVEHHLAHLWSARYLSPSSELAMLSLDGMGDFVSTTLAKAKDKVIEPLHQVTFPHSLGFFYTAMTQFLGFPHYGDEFKVMGLSSFGQPTHSDTMRELIRLDKSYRFQLNNEAFPLLKKVPAFYIERGQPKIQPLFNGAYLTQVLGIPQRKAKDPVGEEHKNIAKSVQLRFEEVANQLLQILAEKTGLDEVALAGGCAHNSVWVGKIPTQTPFRKVWVAPACHDAGIAVGAAIAAYGDVVSPEGGNWALLGPEPAPIRRPIAPAAITSRNFSEETPLIEWMVKELIQQKIVAVCYGRMEFGPRALGHRTILADPRMPEIRDRLNSRVKHRETFRPFAASVMEEYQEAWFEHSFPSPYMEAVFGVREERRDQVRGVVHADGTCRIQTVGKSSQPFFHKLLSSFHQKTGIPMLINTSFNDNEPLVCSEEDAWNCFVHTDLDHLVLGRRTFSRKEIPESVAL